MNRNFKKREIEIYKIGKSETKNRKRKYTIRKSKFQQSKYTKKSN